MDRETEWRLARIEGKINVIARWLVVVVAIAVASGVYFLFRNESWGSYFGLGAGFLAGLAFERAFVALEKRLPDQRDNED